MKHVVFTFILLLYCNLAWSEMVSMTGSEISKTEESPIYQKYQLVCNVCNAIDTKKAVEKALKEDMKYSKKYGVINYGRRDGGVQVIKRNDAIILMGKKDYNKKYGHKFDLKECDLVNSDDCEGALFELSAKISGKVPWEPDDHFPKP